jgi:hypothetical protein
MTNQHPITPPPELITDWCKQRACISEPGPIHVWLATQAARWGADQELEACCEWTAIVGGAEALRAARRPKPPSLKEQALADLDALVADLSNHGMGFKTTNMRRALEALPE